MKKLIFIGIALLLTFSFAACKVLFWDFDKSVSELVFYYTEANLKIVPDYQIRSLSIEYETEGNDAIKTDGIVGGEYFDRFEGVVEILDSDSLETNGTCVGDYNLSYTMTNVSGNEYNEKLHLCDDYSEDVEFVRDFYLDTVKLLVEDPE
jgi:hypothetical protein